MPLTVTLVNDDDVVFRVSVVDIVDVFVLLGDSSRVVFIIKWSNGSVVSARKEKIDTTTKSRDTIPNTCIVTERIPS
jgi:hypothetical protein